MRNKRKGIAIAMIVMAIAIFTGTYSLIFAENGETTTPAYGWSAKASMKVARKYFGAAACNGKIYAIGGYNGTYLNSVEEYDCKTNAWVEKAAMPTARSGHGVIELNGKIYAIGGFSNNSWIGAVEEYDPLTNTWTSKGNMPVAIRNFAITALNGKIYVVGGERYTEEGMTYGYENSMFEYDPLNNVWQQKASMATYRTFLGASVSNGKIYAIGGYDSNKRWSKTIDEYNPVTNSWATVGEMRLGRGNFGIVNANNRVYLLGGTGANGIVDIVEELNTRANRWTTMLKLPTAKKNLVAVYNDGVIYTIGGENSATLNTVEAYNIPIPKDRVEKSVSYKVSQGNNFNADVTVSGIESFKGYNFTVQYNPNEVEIADLYGATKKADIFLGQPEGSNVIVSEAANGIIKFTVSKSIASNKYWSGVINNITFKSKINGETAVKIIIE